MGRSIGPYSATRQICCESPTQKNHRYELQIAYDYFSLWGPSTASLPGICSVLIVIILVNYLISIKWSNGQEVAWLEPQAAWWLNLCPESIATEPREMLTGAFNLR
jgi:hypothetical protein